jgi:hypothetical protein
MSLPVADRLASLHRGMAMGLRLFGAAIGIAYFVWMFSFGKRRGWMALIEATAMTALGAAATELMRP